MSVPARRSLTLLALPALALCAAILLPALDKPFTIDDPYFLLTAEQVQRNPLHPTAFEIGWGPDVTRVSAANGPVMAYLLLPCIMLGGAEWAAHLMQLIMLGLGVLATVALARQRSLPDRTAILAGLLVASAPAVLGMAATAMPDVPAMACATGGIYFFCRFCEEGPRGRALQAVAAAVLLALAVLLRSHTALLLPLAALGLRRRLVCALPLGAAVMILVLVAALTRDKGAPAGNFFSAILALVGASPPVLKNLCAWLVHYTLTMPLGALFLLTATSAGGRPFPRRVFYLALLLGAVLLVVTGWGRHAALAFAFALSAAALIGEGAAARQPGQGADPQFPGLLWGWLLLALPILAYHHMAPKYLVVSAPACALLLAPRLDSVLFADRKGAWSRLLPALCIAVLVGQSVLGSLIIRADARFAAVGQRAAAELVAPYVRAGRRVWFAGGWGFHWYAVRAGGRPIAFLKSFGLVAGDLLVSSENTWSGGLVEWVPERLELRTLVEPGPGGRVMSRAHGAGFFANDWGYLPYAYGSGDIDRFTLWEIR